MEYIGKIFDPKDNSWCRDLTAHKSATLAEGFRPEEEKTAVFTIVQEPYTKKVYLPFIGTLNKTFINIKSSNTGHVYKVLFNEFTVRDYPK